MTLIVWQGFPTTCNAGCAAVLNPLLHHCRAFLQKGGAVTAQILQTVTAAAAACPKPCADFNGAPDMLLTSL
jgi:hypothetical protein